MRFGGCFSRGAMVGAIYARAPMQRGARFLSLCVCGVNVRVHVRVHVHVHVRVRVCARCACACACACACVCEHLCHEVAMDL